MSAQKDTPLAVMLRQMHFADCIPRFNEMGITTVVALRRLDDRTLEECVPDATQRQKLKEMMMNRGNPAQRVAEPADTDMPPRPADGDFSRPRYDDMRGGRGRGRGRGRGGRGGGGGRGGFGASKERPCRNFFGDGCQFGENCRYSHDAEAQRRMQELMDEHGEGVPPYAPHYHEQQHGAFELSVDVPTRHLGLLLGGSGQALRRIIEEFHVTHEHIRQNAQSSDERMYEVKLYGESPEDLEKAKEAILRVVFGKKKEEMHKRFQYAQSELERNQQAVRTLVAANEHTKETNRHLSEDILKNVVSSFRFTHPQKIKHFYIKTLDNEKDKMDAVSKIVSQLKGIQAVLFFPQKRVTEMAGRKKDGSVDDAALARTTQRLARNFPGVTPQFLCREQSKTERMTALEAFKEGVANEAGVRQRLLVTSEDYAKLARKTVIPFVNVVISFTVPRREDFYLVQSLVAGRRGTVGASLICVCDQETAVFDQLSKNIDFNQFVDESSFRDVATELTYDTVDAPLTSEDAEPAANWRDTIDA